MSWGAGVGVGCGVWDVGGMSNAEVGYYRKRSKKNITPFKIHYSTCDIRRSNFLLPYSLIYLFPYLHIPHTHLPRKTLPDQVKHSRRRQPDVDSTVC